MSGKLSWKAKAKVQKRKLADLGLVILKQHEVIKKAVWLTKILRQNRQQQDAEYGSDMSPLDMTVEEQFAMHEFEVYYNELVNPAAWFPIKTGLFCIATA